MDFLSRLMGAAFDGGRTDPSATAKPEAPTRMLSDSTASLTASMERRESLSKFEGLQVDTLPSLSFDEEPIGDNEAQEPKSLLPQKKVHSADGMSSSRQKSCTPLPSSSKNRPVPLLNLQRCATMSEFDRCPASPLLGAHSFTKIKVLGVGSFGKVVLCQKKGSDSLYAMKIVKESKLTTRMRQRIKMERNVMALHRHPFIVKLHHAFRAAGRLHFVMDYCPGGDLYYHLHPSRSSRRGAAGMAKFVAAQLCLALGHLHEHGVVYRDLKPENVLFDANGYIKLADFGLTKGGVFGPLAGARSVCGSLHYMAPEVLTLGERGPQAEYGTAVDWWGLGVLLYEMFWGLPPWYTDDQAELVRRVKEQPLRLPPALPAPAAAFLSGLLEKDPARRLGSAPCPRDAARALRRHAYFHRVEFDRLLRREYAPTFRPPPDGAVEVGEGEGGGG
ncbi:unnamed protein product, partial [Heterosigma akashiwo]